MPMKIRTFLFAARPTLLLLDWSRISWMISVLFLPKTVLGVLNEFSEKAFPTVLPSDGMNLGGLSGAQAQEGGQDWGDLLWSGLQCKRWSMILVVWPFWITCLLSKDCINEGELMMSNAWCVGEGVRLLVTSGLAAPTHPVLLTKCWTGLECSIDYRGVNLDD